MTRLVLTVEVGEALEPGAVLLPRVPDECLADPLQHLLPVQDHDDQDLLTLSCVLCPPCMIVTLRVTRERQTRAIDKTYRRVHKQTSDMTWRKQIKLATTKSGQCVYYLFLYIYLFYKYIVSVIISSDCWGQFVWICLLRVSCIPGLSPAARCRCRDPAREPCQVIQIMATLRRHYAQPQGSLQLFEADSVFSDESCIM